MRPDRIEAVEIDGPAGALEAVLELPAEPIRAVGVVCHPHPQFGGTMQNKVVHTLGRTLVALGVAALRFNFRGVGRSDGHYGEGVGELEDAASAADFMAARWPDRPLWLAGFSFGAMIALRLAARRQTARLVTVAPPVQQIAAQAIRQPDCPWLIVQGGADELVDCDAVVAWVDALDPGPELVVLEGVDHFFHGRLTELRETLLANLGTQSRP